MIFMLFFNLLYYFWNRRCLLIQDNMGQVQFHLKTSEPLQNCYKTDFIIAIKTIEKIVKDTFLNANNSTAINTTSSTPTDNCSNSK